MTLLCHPPRSRKNAFKRTAEPIFVDRVALPDCLNRPSKFLKLGYIPQVPSHIRVEFRGPEIRTGLRHCRPFATSMSVPETTVHEDGQLVSW